MDVPDVLILREPCVTVGCASGSVLAATDGIEAEGIDAAFTAAGKGTLGATDGIDTEGSRAKEGAHKITQLIASIICNRYFFKPCPIIIYNYKVTISLKKV